MTAQDQHDEKYLKMTQTPIPKLIMQLGLPTIASMLITSIYNMTDTYFVGTLGKSASGAIGIVFSLMAILQAFGFMFGHGAGSIISRRLGQHDRESASRFASTGFFLALAVGGIIGIAGLCFQTPFMYLLGSTDTILPYALDYSFCILLAAPFYTGSCVLNNILRYEGMAFYAMLGLVSGAVLNMILDPLCILVLHMGTMGAGVSTALSQIISFSILVSVFLRGKTDSKLHLRSFTKSWRDIWLIISTGIPSLIRQGLGSISVLLLNHQAGIYGDAAVAAMSIVGRISQFIFSVNIGIGQGFQPVASFNYGARRYNRVRSGFWFAVLFSEATLLLMAMACLLFAPSLVSLFQKDAGVVEIGIPALRYQCISCLLLPISACGNMMFQSVGCSGKASLLASLRNGLFYIPLILLLPMALGLTGVQLAQPFSDVLTFSVTLPLSLQFLRRLARMDDHAQSLQTSTHAS